MVTPWTFGTHPDTKKPSEAQEREYQEELVRLCEYISESLALTTELADAAKDAFEKGRKEGFADGVEIDCFKGLGCPMINMNI